MEDDRYDKCVYKCLTQNAQPPREAMNVSLQKTGHYLK
jgi:hypothetical protein